MARNTGTDPALFTGTPRFALVREIGSGGMGIVFEALDRERSSRVALKTLNRVNPTDLYRFKKEFRCLESLVHPNLVTLYELIAEKGHWFFTMELVHGEDFLTFVRGQVRPGAAETILGSESTLEGIPSSYLGAGALEASFSTLTLPDATIESAMEAAPGAAVATTIRETSSATTEIGEDSILRSSELPVFLSKARPEGSGLLCWRDRHRPNTRRLDRSLRGRRPSLRPAAAARRVGTTRRRPPSPS